jgi:hypothetical protein
MSTETDRSFLAGDAFRAWKKRVQAASESIVVFGPYLDSLLDRLLKKSALEVDAITVVTDLRTDSGTLDYRKQLIGVRALLRRGIEVRSLPRLHAKVLLCDWQTATIGSQNFTGYGRGSHETTVVPADDLSESKFVATLREWYDEAKPVDLTFVERLLADLEKEMEALQVAQATLAASYEQLWEEYQRQLEEERRRREQAARLAPIGVRLNAAVRSAQEILPRPAVWAHLKEVGDWSARFNTLRAKSGSHFTRLLIPDGHGFTDLTLSRLHMYPVILNPSGRMGFGRVGSTQISYVRTSVEEKNPQTIAGMTYRMLIECPDQDFETANVHITLRPEFAPSTAAVKLLVQFDCMDAELVDHEIVGDGVFWADVPGSGLRALSTEKVAASFADPEPRRQLMQFALDSFMCEELQINIHNADEFFPTGWLRVTLVEYAEQPVFVASQQT